jgi:A/G-specific adenine glycosylase
MAARNRIKLRPSGDLAHRLLDWYSRGHRDLPWRRSSDPYRIWVSEIMLQQTRAQAVIPYYERFLQSFPTVDALAAAREEDVLARWAGLGYYSRARNLWHAAGRIAAAGAFPTEYDAIRALPGIGDYTAAAIGSIAFGLPHVVVDGNVLRVVARIENDPADIASSRTRERFRAVAQSWLDPAQASAFNQALMELGATVCLPRNPLCLVCPLNSCCRAHEVGTAAQLPVKLRTTVPVRLDRTLLLVRREDKVLLRQNDKDARHMAGFWDLPSPPDLPDALPGEVLGEFRHTITHHHYRIAVQAATLSGAPPARQVWFHTDQFAGIPISTTARKALKVAGLL